VNIVDMKVSETQYHYCGMSMFYPARYEEEMERPGILGW